VDALGFRRGAVVLVECFLGGGAEVAADAFGSGAAAPIEATVGDAAAAVLLGSPLGSG
jgi:hypothetical protein